MKNQFLGSDRPYLDGEYVKELTVTARYPYAPGSGCCFHFSDGEGHVVVWFTKRRAALVVGQRVRAAFVVTSHKNFEGVKQNIAKKFRIL